MENIKEAQEKFRNWLKSESNEVCYIKVNKFRYYAFFKNRIKEGIDLIFYYETDDDHVISVRENPEYEGVYKVDEDKLYGGGNVLEMIFGEDEINKTSFHKIRYEFMEKVRAGVNAKVREIEDDIIVSDADRTNEESYANDKARSIYINNTETNYKYECGYEDERFHKKFLEYLICPNKVVERSVNKFYANHLDSIKKRIVTLKMIEELVEKYEKGEYPFVTSLKNIIHSIPQNCKTVNVTVVIDGIEMTFKYEADMLKRDCGYYYSKWYMPSADRAAYNNRYGSRRDFTPEDITKITYSRRVIYERS